MIDGVKLIPKKQILDERGRVMHMLRKDDPEFQQFGEIYFSTVYPGRVKGWHVHDKMTLNYVVVAGLIKMVLYDERENSPTKGELQEIFLGEGNYALLVIPPGVVNGFKGVGMAEAIVANCATIPHDPTEIRRYDPHKSHIPYSWEAKDR